ncbi:hypothetical protein FRC18_008931, partial [Serendipita sp. 400]
MAIIRLLLFKELNPLKVSRVPVLSTSSAVWWYVVITQGANADTFAGLSVCLGAHNTQYDSLPESPALSVASSFPSGASSYMFSQSATSSPPHLDPALLNELGYNVYAYTGRDSRHYTDSEHEHHDPLGLVIPSLSLPPPVSSSEGTHSSNRRREGRDGHRSSRWSKQQRTTAYGETLGNLELYVFGRKGIGKTTLANALIESNEDVVLKSDWKRLEPSSTGEGDLEGFSSLVASTAWLDSNARKGMSNVKIHELDGFEEGEGEKASEVLQPLLRSIHERFENVETGLSSALPASQAVTEMMASSNSPLPTALIFILSTPPTSLELTLLSLISTHIPTITLPPYPNSLSTIPSLSSIVPRSSESTILLGPSNRSSNTVAPRPFRPRNTAELREGLFRSPKTLRALRSSAVERFEHWREIRKACEDMGLGAWVSSPSATLRKKPQEEEPSKRRRLEWELRLSQDVAVALNADLEKRRKKKRGSSKLATGSEEALASLEEGGEQFFSASGDDAGPPETSQPHGKMESRIKDEPDFPDVLYQSELRGSPDPLHIPTLFKLSTALLGALGKRLVSSLIMRNPPLPPPPPSSQHGRNRYREQEATLVKLRESGLGQDGYRDEEGSWGLGKWGIA